MLENHKQFQVLPVYGSNAISKDNIDFYEIVLQNYKSFTEVGETELADVSPMQSNIRLIQKIYLDFISTTKPVTIANVPITLSDNRWDFSSQFKSGKTANWYIYQFDGFTLYQETILKLYVLYKISDKGIHNSTIHGKFDMIKRIFNYMDERNYVSLKEMKAEDYQDWLDSRHVSKRTTTNIKILIKELTVFYSLIAEDIYTPELKAWLEDTHKEEDDAERELNKTALLPTDFYIEYTKKLYETVMDKSKETYDRSIAGLLYIGTQTGLRTAELTILRVQDLEIKTFRDKTIGIINYRSTKSVTSRNKVYEMGKMNANKKVIEVYQLIIELLADLRKKYDTDILVPVKSKKNTKSHNNRNNITTLYLGSLNRSFCFAHREELGLLNAKNRDFFAGCYTFSSMEKDGHVFSIKTMREAGIKPGDTLSYPTIRQFRVYVASELRARGVSDRTTAYVFNHHCIEMYGYYTRPMHSVQEDIDFSREIIKDVVKDQTKILGPKGDALTNKINGIIAENNFNVEKDLDAIIEKVCNEVPIRAKLGGFCMKSNPRRECRHDADTDEFLCAYGCCPNHCHMYFMLPITWDKAKTIKQTYDYNIQAGYKNASEKEGYKLLSTIVKELLPELEETKRELSRRTKAEIVKAHPDMGCIINNLNLIEKEVLEWRNMIEKK